jgi:hypothetical protein
MNQLLRIIEFVTYLGGLVGLVTGVISRFTGAIPVAPRGALVFAAASFLCALATEAVAAQLPKAKEEAKTKAAAA